MNQLLLSLLEATDGSRLGQEPGSAPTPPQSTLLIDNGWGADV